VSETTLARVRDESDTGLEHGDVAPSFASERYYEPRATSAANCATSVGEVPTRIPFASSAAFFP